MVDHGQEALLTPAVTQYDGIQPLRCQLMQGFYQTKVKSGMSVLGVLVSMSVVFLAIVSVLASISVT